MTTEKEQLEAEIAKRDTQIAELERFKCAYNEWHEKTEWVQSEVSTGIIGASALGLHRADVMTRLVAELRLELAALKAQQPSAGVVDERAAFERHFKSVGSLTVNQLAHARDTDGMPFYEHLPTRIAWSAWQARARLNQPTAGDGVLCALMSALEGVVHDQRVPNEVSQECAAVLIEARRLNPCRAQAVPDDEELKLLRAFYKCCASITDQLADSPKSALARLVEAVKDAAPSAQQKESER